MQRVQNLVSIKHDTISQAKQTTTAHPMLQRDPAALAERFGSSPNVAERDPM
jgi:hypothetical protein